MTKGPIRQILGDSVEVRGSDKVTDPEATKMFNDYFEGKGIPADWYKEHYGTHKGLEIKPKVVPLYL